MDRSHRKRMRWFHLITVVIMIWLVATVPAATRAQPSPPGAQLLDYAALLLQPVDLEAAGMPGFYVNAGQTFMTIEELLATDVYLDSRGWMEMSAIPDASALLQISGWQRLHELHLAKPDPHDPGFNEFSVSQGVEVYAAAEGATAAFAAHTNEPALETTLDGLVIAMPGTTPLGDQSVMFRNISTADGAPANSVTLMIRVGNLILGTSMVDFTGQHTPDAPRIEELATLVLERVETVRSAGLTGGPCLPGDSFALHAAVDAYRARSIGVDNPHMPGMSTCVQRLIGDGVSTNQARYLTLDGVAIPLMREYAGDETTAARQADVTNSGLVDSYQVTYIVDAPGGRVFYTVQIDAYTNERAATASFDGLEARLGSGEDYELASFTPATPTTGDTSATWVGTTIETGKVVTNSAVRIDAIIVEVRVSQTDAPIPATVQSLMTTQVACMEAGGCIAPIPAPPELLAVRPDPGSEGA